MAKKAYRIPSDLDTSPLDMEISLKNSDGVGVKPVPIKVILAVLASILACYYIVSSTFIREASLFLKVLFVLGWIALTALLLKTDKTKRMGFHLVPVLLGYLPKRNRQVYTRSTNKAGPFYSILGIESIDDVTGLVKYLDGTYAYWYRVVGSASVLLFEDDKNAILDRVDSFWQKQSTDYEIIFLTTKASQKVYQQAAALQERMNKLDIVDEDLDGLLNEQFQTLKHQVGEMSKSVHQYMILKADNEEALQHAKNIFQSEVENSTRMIKQCTALYYNDITEILRMIYRGQ